MADFKRSEPDSFELVQVAKEDSGLKYDIYLYSSGKVKEYLTPIVEIDYGTDLTPVLVFSANEIRLIKKSDLPATDFEEISDYLKRNYDIIVKHWNCEMSDKEVLNTLYKRDNEANV